MSLAFAPAPAPSRKRALSPEVGNDGDQKRMRPMEMDVAEAMDVDMEQPEQHPLAPCWDGSASRDGNEFLADALYHDPQLYAPPCSPTLDATVPDHPFINDMQQDDTPCPSQKSAGPYNRLDIPLSPLSDLSTLPESHPLRTQLSLGALSTADSSSYSSGPATPSDACFDEESPCNPYGDASCTVAQPFFGFGHA